jgi:transcription antitermination factor NusG
VLEIPGVLSLAGARREPTPVPDTYVNSLKEALLLKKIEPHPYLVVGEKVRIRYGSMAGIEGILIRKKNNFRVVITLEMIFQSIAVEVDAADLELVSPLRMLA